MPEMIAGMRTYHLGDSFSKGFSSFNAVNDKVSKFLEFRERCSELEEDETFQQFVVYITFSTKDKSKWLYYSRAKMGEAESRLDKYLSVGFGGHVNQGDVEGSAHNRHAFVLAACREIAEEIPRLKETDIQSLAIKGWIRDISNPVGRVHLGIYIECCVSEASLLDLGFNVLPVESFDLFFHKFEGWSQIVLRKEGIVL